MLRKIKFWLRIRASVFSVRANCQYNTNDNWSSPTFSS
jgi:hypothetical protein